MNEDTRTDAGEYYPGGGSARPRVIDKNADMKHSEFADVATVPPRFTDTTLRDKLNEVIGKLKGPATAALAVALVLAATADVITVQKAQKGTVYNDEQIVTNVTFDATAAQFPAASITNAPWLTSESDPNVPSWAKAENKPSYSYNEISGTPDISAIALAATNYTDAAAALSSRRGPATWTFNPATLEGGTFSVSPEDFEDIGWHWFLRWSPSESDSPTTVAAISGDKSDTTVDFMIGSYMELPEELQPHWGESVIATLVTPELPGYVLGSQTNMPLASEAEAEALRVAKQDKLPYSTNAVPWAAISGKPSLATVATSGSYNDLSNKPTIPTVPTAQINAATTTNALQDAAIAGKADTNDVVLTERTGFSNWTIEAPEGADPNTVDILWGDPYGRLRWYFVTAFDWVATENEDPNATMVVSMDGHYKATRTALQGYQLGSQTYKPLASVDMALTNSTAIAALSAQLAAAASSATNYTDLAIVNADTTYRMVVGLTNLNQTVQYVNAPASATELAIQLPADGNTKDWIVYVNAATNMTLTLPPATWWMADTAYTNALEASSKTALYFSQVTDGTYILGRQAMEAVVVPEVTP